MNVTSYHQSVLVSLKKMFWLTLFLMTISVHGQSNTAQLQNAVSRIFRIIKNNIATKLLPKGERVSERRCLLRESSHQREECRPRDSSQCSWQWHWCSQVKKWKNNLDLLISSFLKHLFRSLDCYSRVVFTSILFQSFSDHYLGSGEKCGPQVSYL